MKRFFKIVGLFLIVSSSINATGLNNSDNISQNISPLIQSSFDNDIELNSIKMPDYCVQNDSISIEASLKNIGNSVVTSFEGVCLINGVITDTFAFSDIEIEELETYSFTVGNDFVFNSPGIFIVEVKISLVNGVKDEADDNNMLTHEISIATESISRKPLFEMFTSSTCCPCYEGNETLDAVLSNNSIDSFSLVKYPLNWPGDGDIYFNDDCGIRDMFYEILGVPTLMINGRNMVTPNAFTQSEFDQALIEPAYVDLTLDYSFDGIRVNASLTLDPKINIENVSVHFAVVEKTTYNNVGTNGETEFHNVMMKMLPDGSGTSTSLTIGENVSFEVTADLTSTFIEEFDDLKIVAWVQDNQTFSILQSESHELDIQSTIENSGLKPIHVFPNPGKGIIHISASSNAKIEIVDVEGKVMYKDFFTETDNILDLSHFQRGIYFIRMLLENGERIVKKIILE